ncbi:response regulator transcription factor [Geobacter pelophilus]|uniref:Response regulator transcription factor n=1 Tax=Geoanaerobacter pelophilus TaxID=60036 RepID=A0AAW4L823_9BACT|nr:response regulator transcription factor [Geoanaerobacter pelophilus]MBT0665697.1 response regulator transcription factor [Geoanaerobacter pelophilus]
MPTTILLVDDHPIFREGLRALIEKVDATAVVGEAGDGAEAVRLAGQLKPDMVIMDLTMPVMNGIDATREIKKQLPATKILALSMESDRFFVVEVLKAGATGYLLKDTAFAELSDAITTVAAGETYLPRKVSTLLVQEFLQCIPEEMSALFQNLSPREREILQLIAAGKSMKEIAYDLGISNKTVENQRQMIMKKLNLFSVAELTKYAVRHGLSPLKK